MCALEFCKLQSLLCIITTLKKSEIITVFLYKEYQDLFYKGLVTSRKGIHVFAFSPQELEHSIQKLPWARAGFWCYV